MNCWDHNMAPGPWCRSELWFWMPSHDNNSVTRVSCLVFALSSVCLFVCQGLTRKSIWGSQMSFFAWVEMIFFPCMFPVADVTNYQKVSDLKSTNMLFNSSGGQKSKMNLYGLKSRFRQGSYPFQKIKGRIRLSFAASKRHLHFLPYDPRPTSQPAMTSQVLTGRHPDTVSASLFPTEGHVITLAHLDKDFFGGSDSKESACSSWNLGSIPGLGRSPGWGNGLCSPVFLPENPMERGTWWATVPGIAELDMTEQLTLSPG